MVVYSPVKTFCRFILIALLLLLPTFALAAAPSEQNGSSTNELFEKGAIRSVSASDQTLTLNKENGDKTHFVIDSQTVFVGFVRFQDLHREDRVKVWYRIDPTQKVATKIEKLPELGC